MVNAIATSIPKTKKMLALELGISRSSLYYTPKRQVIDLEVKAQIKTVLNDNPAYGHKRIAIELQLNHKRILRVMKKYGIKPYRRRSKKPRKLDDEGKPAVQIINVSKILCPIVPHLVWVSDFTYIKFQGRFVYLATLMDLYTREIVGWNISRFHNTALVLGALEDALKRAVHLPKYLHSDQGSEYDSQKYQEAVKKVDVTYSMSDKGSPWQNGFQESFYGKFKVDLGRTDRYDTLGELIEAIHLQLNYYNKKRIHSKLKMAPVQFKQKFVARLQNEITDIVSKEWGT
jgi:putative transposase